MAYAYTRGVRVLTKGLDTSIVNTVRKGPIDLGESLVTITTIDASQIADDGIVSVAMTAESGKLHTEKILMLTTEGDFTARFKKFLVALGVLDNRLFEVIQESPTNLGLLTGMGLKILMAQQDGYVIEVDAAGEFVVITPDHSEVLRRGFLTRRDAFEWMQQSKIKYARRYVAEFHPWRKYAADINPGIFNTALQTIQTTKDSNSVSRW